MDKKLALKTSITIALIVLLTVSAKSAFIRRATAADDNWTLVNNGTSLKGYPSLREYSWQKVASMPPNGAFDKIGLHRLIKLNSTAKGVVFICPGTYASGETILSNPPESSLTLSENSSQPIYWANRGFDVYVIDYRTHFVPSSINSTSQLAFMADWGWDQWISDIKEGVNKAKEVSGTSKVFIAGQSFGGNAAIFYASKYWPQDLLGIILLDGGTPSKRAVTTNKYNLTATLNLMKASGNWTLETPNLSSGAISNVSSGIYFRDQYAFNNPSAPAEYPSGTPLQPTINPLTNRTWANITEYMSYQFMAAKTSNIDDGIGNVTADIYWSAMGDRYWPVRLSVENSAIFDWTNCPDVTYDFDDNYKNINVPLLSFTSGLFGYPMRGNLTNGLATTDFTSILLPKYGHLDVFTGIYSARDVSQPVLDWMLGQLSGLKATAFCNVAVLPGWTWYFFVHSCGGIGSCTYQWYEGTTLLQGQTSMVLPVTKTTIGVYTYYCKITDSQGAATNSNTVTLTVI
jgi:pimeloyl-ACP methyl ester carboxylesterase